MQTIAEKSVNFDMASSINLLLVYLCFFFGTVALELNWHFVILAVGGSFAGAMVLSYFRREQSRRELAFKIGSSSMCGLVCGSILIEYYAFEKIAYVLGCYFFSSVVFLAVIRALISATENNADGVIITVFQRVFNINLRRRKKISRQRIEKKEGENL